MIKKYTVISWLLFIVLFFFLISPGFSAGTSGGVILKYSPGVRQNSLGGCGSALAEDFNSINYNPALLSTIDNFYASALYDSFFDDSYIYYLGAGKKTAVADIGITALGFNGGNITINDPDEINDTETLTAQSDYTAALIISRYLTEKLSLGASGKYYSSTLLEKYSATAFALDAGMFLNTGLFKRGNIRWINRPYSGGLNLGLSVKNIGSDITYINHAAPLPFMYRGGLAYFMRFNARHSLNILADGVKDNESDMKYSAGVEYGMDNMFFLRAGYRINYEIKNFSLGLGIKYNNIIFDYGMLMNSAINNSHQLVLSLKL